MNVRPLLCLALIHTLVDAYSQALAPLWPRLGRELNLGPWSLALLYYSWQVTTSISQPLFGYWGDRNSARWVIALGPALVIVGVSLVGYAGGPVVLSLLLITAGLGNGIFHPEAAAGVAALSEERPAAGLALFTFAGMAGLGLGPVCSGAVVTAHGLRGLAWLAPPGLLLFVVLLAMLRPLTKPAEAVGPPLSLAEMVDGRWAAAGLLLAVATLRVVPCLGIPLGLAFLLQHAGHSDAVIGRDQSLFLLSGSLGALTCPLFARRGWELSVMVVTTLLAAGCLVLLAWREPVAYYVGLAGSGLLLQGAMPVLIAYSQQLLPRGRRLAASLTLGASWGFGGLIVGGLQAYFSNAGWHEGMLWAMVPFALATAAGSALLPRRTGPAAKVSGAYAPAAAEAPATP